VARLTTLELKRTARMSLQPNDSVRPLEPTLEAARRPQITLNANETPADGAQPAWHDERPLVLIESEASGVPLGLSDFWTYRELLYFLTWRDVKVRYKQTLMGAAWVIIQPLLTMFVVTIVF